MQIDRNHLSRAQPWLGTFVEIRAEAAGRSRWHALSVIDTAFAEVATIHRLLSRQERGTDVVALARAGVGQVVQVDWRTVEVLRLALELRDASGGRFDPERPDQSAAGGEVGPRAPAWSIEGSDAVRVLRRAELDLDGIAKGYAVDRAIAVCQSAELRATVNAGGDLRSSGAFDDPLLIRAPTDDGSLVNLGRLRKGAFATSQSRVRPGFDTGFAGAGIRDPGMHRRLLPLMSVGVAASSCAVADALTKVVAVDPDAAGATLDTYAAAAWILRVFDGALHMRHQGSTAIVTRDAA
jgi:FAD:protein FMN transferase